jgi:hypothetical protein
MRTSAPGSFSHPKPPAPSSRKCRRREFGIEFGREFDREFGREFGIEFGREFDREFGREFGIEFGREFGIEFGREFDREFGREFGIEFGREFGIGFYLRQNISSKIRSKMLMWLLTLWGQPRARNQPTKLLRALLATSILRAAFPKCRRIFARKTRENTVYLFLSKILAGRVGNPGQYSISTS